MIGQFQDTGCNPLDLQSLVAVFPNANFMISHNLLTQNATPDGAILRQRDQAALDVVNQCLTDPRCETVRAPPLTMQQRLQEFTKPSK